MKNINFGAKSTKEHVQTPENGFMNKSGVQILSWRQKQICKVPRKPTNWTRPVGLANYH